MGGEILRFIIIGDSKGKDRGINEKVMVKIMRQCCKLNPQPEFIVLCGDSVAGSPDEKQLVGQLSNLKELIEKYTSKTVVFPVIGNHEVNGLPTDDRYEKIISNFYSNFSPTGYLEGYNKTVYYFDFPDSRLIVLNSFHYGAIHRFEKDQLTWLQQTASVNKKNKLVFVHSPAFPTGAHLGHCLDLYPDCRNEFWNIINNCAVDVVFSGHEHNYSRRILKRKTDSNKTIQNNDVYQVISGGGGEKLRDKYKDKKGVVVPPICLHHYLVVDMDSFGIKVCAISSEGKKIDSFEINKE